MSEYSEYIVKTYTASGAGSSKPIRARPLAGQGISTETHVECSSQMRNNHPVGTLFVITAKVTDREGGAPFLYTSFRWSYRVISSNEALAIINRRKLG